MEKRLLTVKDVAHQLQLSTKSVYALTSDGLIRFHRVGKRSIRFAPSDIARFLEARTNAPETPRRRDRKKARYETAE